MPKLVIAPHAGLMKRLPEHRLVGDKKQYLFQAMNYIDINGSLTTMLGNERYDAVAKSGLPAWAKRLYYHIGSDDYRTQFAIIGGKMYKGTDINRTLNQVAINGSFDITIDTTLPPMDTSIEVSGNVSTFLVDGTYFYKFNPNIDGYWEQLPIKEDVDGNDIEPIDIISYQDRTFVLVKKRNVILFSKNLDPENYSDSTDAGLIQLPSGNGGFPQRLIIHRGFLHVIHEDYFSPVTGSSALTYGVNPGDIVYGFGTRAPLSVVGMQQFFVFQNSQDNEIYQTAGTLDSTSKQPLSYNVQLGTLINPIKANLTACVLDPNTDCLRVSYVPTGEAVPNAELLYSINEEKWAGETYGKKISRYCLWDGNGDQNELMTLRADVGCIMFEGRTLNIDGGPQRYWFITGDYSDNYYNDCQFTEFFVDAHTFGTLTKLPLGYYLDARITTRGLEQVTLQGEVINLGLIEISEQTIMLERVVPLIDRSKGRMIRFACDETVSNTQRQIYSFMATYNKQNLRNSKYTVGA